MNVIEGQANRKKKFSLIFYSLTFNNILNIIVMLILVGVTITVALNGGLFKTAQEATTNTLIEAEREQLLSAVVAAIGDDAKVNFTKLDSNLPTSEWTGSNGTYTSPKGNKYTVDAKGKISDGTLQTKTYSFTVGELLAKVNNETNTITLDDLKELCKDEGLEINKYLVTLDGSNLCYISSDDSKLCSMESWTNKFKNNQLNRRKCNDTYNKR